MMPSGVQGVDIERPIREVVAAELARMPLFRTELTLGQHGVC